MKRAAIVMVLLVIAAFVGWKSVRHGTMMQASESPGGGGPASTRQGPSSRSALDAAAPGAPQAATPATAAKKGGAASSSRDPLPADFPTLYETARDKKALLEQLSRSESPEAPYFIAKILRDCRFVSAFGVEGVVTRWSGKLSATPDQRVERERVFRQMLEPCARFEGAKIEQPEIDRWRNEGVRRGDPRAIASSLATAFPRGDVTDETRAQVSKLIATADPYVLLELPMVMGRLGGGTYLISGEAVPEASKSAADTAWQMIACDFGLPCGPDSEQVRIACALEGYCGLGSVEEVFRVMYTDRNAAALAYRAAILTALQASDLRSLGAAPLNDPNRRP